MAALTAENFDTLFPQSERDKHWKLTERVMKEVLGASADDLAHLAQCKEQIAGAPTFLGKALIYHDDFVEMARQMVGVGELSADQMLQCKTIERELFPAA